jgi:hypothetical protein
VAGAAGLGGAGADPLVGGAVVLVDGLAGDWGAGPVEFLAGSTGAGGVTGLVSFLGGATGAGGAVTFLGGSGFKELLTGAGG